MSKPKQQHYNPAAWLALFTAEGTRDGRLWVFDPEKRKQWGSQPTKSAREADYLTIRKDGVDPYLTERLLGRVEDSGLPLLRRIVREQVVPDSDHLNRFFIFLAVQFLRGPAFRELIVGGEEKLLTMALRMMGTSRDLFEQTRAAYVAANPGKDLTWDSLQKVLSDPGFAVKAGNPAHRHAESLSSVVLDTAFVLRQREWVVREIEDGAPDLVTSDHPVTLIWLHPDDYPDWRPPGLAIRDTEVFVALTRRVALIGRFDESPPKGSLSKADVADLNRRTVLLSYRYVFGPDPTVLVRSWDGRLDRIECIPERPSFAGPVPWEIDGWLFARAQV